MKIGTSPLTGIIYAGKVSKTGLWIGNKSDVTDTAPLAVAEHLIQRNERIQFNRLGKIYVLKVEEIEI
ncbi:MAG: hypothetical protein V4608_14880 [Bacteroidota bacterium]